MERDPSEKKRKYRPRRVRKSDADILAEMLNSNPPDDWLRAFLIARKLQELHGSPKVDLEEELVYLAGFGLVPVDHDPVTGQMADLQVEQMDHPTVWWPSVGRDGKFRIVGVPYPRVVEKELDRPEEFLRFRRSMIKLLLQGRLDRVRKCKQCGLWLGARRSDQLFCGTKCRQRYFQNRDDVREKRQKARNKCYRNVAGWLGRNGTAASGKPRGVQ